MRGQDVGRQDLESRDTAQGEIGVAVDGLSQKPSNKIGRIGRPALVLKIETTGPQSPPQLTATIKTYGVMPFQSKDMKKYFFPQ